MSVTFYWRIILPTKDHHFTHGTSSDNNTLFETFSGGEISTDDIRTLRAMHRSTGRNMSIWSEIADELERLQGDDNKGVTIKVWPEY